MKTSKASLSTAATRLAALILLASLVTGCQFGQMPTQATPVDTAPTFQAIQTQSAMTVVAELTRSAPSATPVMPTATLAEASAPTETLQPTATNTVAAPVEIPPTPTNTQVTATLRPASTSTPVVVGCKIEELHPVVGDDFNRNADFDGSWKVKNVGQTTWSASAVDIKQVSGTKFQTNDVDMFDLGSDVPVDGTYSVILDMRAPDQLGRFSSTWAFVQGGTTLCLVTITIDVIE